MAISLKLVSAPDEALSEKINSILRDYNRAANPQFWATLEDPRHAAQPLNVFAFDDGKAIGGLFGETRLSWLKISIVAVAAEHRRQGIGSQLITLAETEARQRDCKYSYIDTMDYQAPDLYRKLGYSVVGQLADWDSHGHTKFFMSKKL